MSKSYKLPPEATFESKRLDLGFRHASLVISSMGMSLGKDAPAIVRELEAAYQFLCSRSHGFLRGLTLTHQLVASFSTTMLSVKSQIAVHNHTAAILTELKDLRSSCLTYIKAHPECKETAAIKPPPSDPATETTYPINSAKLHAKVIDGEPWVRLSDIAMAFSGALEFFQGEKKALKEILGSSGRKAKKVKHKHAKKEHRV